VLAGEDETLKCLETSLPPFPQSSARHARCRPT
jgi:hypothetical protein